MGALPPSSGLVVLFIVFGLANDRFLSDLNMANLITQAGSIIILAMGLVPCCCSATSTCPPASRAAWRPA